MKNKNREIKFGLALAGLKLECDPKIQNGSWEKIWNCVHGGASGAAGGEYATGENSLSWVTCIVDKLD
jgi:hypothetical protein